MHVDDEAEVDRIMVQADIFVPGSSSEFLGAVGTSTVDEEVYMSRRGGSPRGKQQRSVDRGGTLARPPPCLFA